MKVKFSNLPLQMLLYFARTHLSLGQFSQIYTETPYLEHCWKFYIFNCCATAYLVHFQGRLKAIIGLRCTYWASTCSGCRAAKLRPPVRAISACCSTVGPLQREGGGKKKQVDAYMITTTFRQFQSLQHPVRLHFLLPHSSKE